MPLLFLEDQRRVQVAVPGVGHGRHRNPVLEPQRVEAMNHLRDLRDRHRDILAEDVLSQLDQHVAELAASVPDAFPLRLRLGDPVVDTVQDLHHLGQLKEDLLPIVAVLLHDQHRLLARLEAGRQEVRHVLQRLPVHQLQRRRQVATLEQAPHRRRGVLDAGEADHRRGVVAGPWHQLHDHLRDDPQGAFGSDEKVQHPVAGGALADPSTELQHAAVGQHHGHADDVVGGQPVFEAMGPAGVAGDVATDGGDRLAGRVGRIHQARLGGGRVEVGVDHAGARHRHQVGRVDLQCGEAFQAQHDAAGERHRAADQAAAGAPRGDRRPRLGA